MRGAEAIVGDESHILHYEQTGAAQVYLMPNQYLQKIVILNLFKICSLVELICAQSRHTPMERLIWMKLSIKFETAVTVINQSVFTFCISLNYDFILYFFLTFKYF